MDNDKRVGRGIELVSGLGFAEVRARLLRIASADEGSNRALAFYLADVAARRLYEDGGHSSAAHFAEAQLEIPERRARELIRVGRELHSLSLVDDAFFAAEIGWTKVLLLLRVVQVATQAEWVDFAQSCSCRELDEEVRRCQQGELPGEGTRIGLEANHRTVHAKLDDKTFALFEKARAFFLERSGREDMTDSEVLTEMTRQFTESQLELDTNEEPESRRAYEDRNHDAIPDEVRGQVMARDRHRCQNCHSYRGPHIHHIEHRAHGGSNEPSNLVVVCAVCHALVHRGKLRIEVDPSAPGTLTFCAADGTPVTRRAQRSSTARRRSIAAPFDASPTDQRTERRAPAIADPLVAPRQSHHARSN